MTALSRKKPSFSTNSSINTTVVGIGRNKKHVKPVEPHLRPKGMGLGADKSAILQDRGVANNKRRKPGDKNDEAEDLKIKRGQNR